MSSTDPIEVAKEIEAFLAESAEHEYVDTGTALNLLELAAGVLRKRDACRHVPDWHSLTLAQDLLPDQVVVDVSCSLCGTSGSFRVDENEVNW